MTTRTTTRPTNTSPPTALDTAITTVLSEPLLVSASPSLAVLVVGCTDDTAVLVLASVVVGTAVTVVGVCVNVLDKGIIGIADVVVGGGVVDGESVKEQQSMYTTCLHAKGWFIQMQRQTTFMLSSRYFVPLNLNICACAVDGK